MTNQLPMPIEKRKEQITELIRAYKERLHELEVQKAKFGASTDPAISIEINEIREKVSDLEGELQSLKLGNDQEEENITRIENQAYQLGSRLSNVEQTVRKNSFSDSVKQYGWVLAAVGLITLIIALVLFWRLNINVPETVTAPPSATILPNSPDALIYSFENSIPSEWSIRASETSTPTLSQKRAFEGQQSLAINASLVERANTQETDGIVQLRLKGRELENKVALARVYVPEEAPTNLYAGFFISDANNEWRSGGGAMLTPGRWTTLAWSTKDAFSWQSPAHLGIQFSLSPGSQASDQRAYGGPIYVDLVELITWPSDIGGPSLDRTLEPLLFYDFESGTVPENITTAGTTQSIDLTEEEHLSPDGNSSLRLNVNMTPYDSAKEEGYGGIRVDLEKAAPIVDALNVSVLIPKREDTRDKNFQVSFVAIAAENSNWVYSGSQPVRVGQWTPHFWGTKYAFSSKYACWDDNEDGQCNDPSNAFLWYKWMDTKIQGFYVRILCDDQSYSGPVYIDNLSAYQVKH